jgi:hypothetical protein
MKYARLVMGLLTCLAVPYSVNAMDLRPALYEDSDIGTPNPSEGDEVTESTSEGPEEIEEITDIINNGICNYDEPLTSGDLIKSIVQKDWGYETQYTNGKVDYDVIINGIDYRVTSENTVKIRQVESKDSTLEIPTGIGFVGKKYTITDLDKGALIGLQCKKLVLSENILRIITKNGDTIMKSPKLEEVKFPLCSDSERFKVPDKMFLNCTKLKYVDFRCQFESIGANAFEGCSDLVGIYGLAHINEIGESAFKNCKSLEFVDLSYSDVTKISKECFSGCSNLKQIHLGEKVLNIESSSFSGTNLSNVVYDGSKDSIESMSITDEVMFNIFNGKNNLVNLVLKDNGDNQNFKAVVDGDVLYKLIGNQAMVWGFGSNDTGEYKIPKVINDDYGNVYEVSGFIKNIVEKDFVKSLICEIDVPDNLFADSSSLEELELGSVRVGNLAFANCESLKKVFYKGTIQEFKSKVKDNAFNETDCNISYKNENVVSVPSLVPSEITSIPSESSEPAFPSESPSVSSIPSESFKPAIPSESPSMTSIPSMSSIPSIPTIPSEIPSVPSNPPSTIVKVPLPVTIGLKTPEADKNNIKENQKIPNYNLTVGNKFKPITSVRSLGKDVNLSGKVYVSEPGIVDVIPTCASIKNSTSKKYYMDLTKLYFKAKKGGVVTVTIIIDANELLNTKKATKKFTITVKPAIPKVVTCSTAPIKGTKYRKAKVKIYTGKCDKISYQKSTRKDFSGAKKISCNNKGQSYYSLEFNYSKTTYLRVWARTKKSDGKYITSSSSKVYTVKYK